MQHNILEYGPAYYVKWGHRNIPKTLLNNYYVMLVYISQQCITQDLITLKDTVKCTRMLIHESLKL